MPTPYKSNKKILLELNSKKFLRCSNNTIVNAEYIEGIDKSNRYVMLVDGFGNRTKVEEKIFRGIFQMLERIYWLLEIISLVICISSIYGVKIKTDIKTVVWIAIEVTFMGMLDREVITTKSYFVIYVLYILYAYIKFKKP